MSSRGVLAGSIGLPVALAVGAVLTPFLIIGAGAAATTSLDGAVLCAGGGTAQTLDGITLSAEQMGNAATIVDVTASTHAPDGTWLPAYAATVALATSYQESGLHNSSVQTDHDSEGLFQQRVSIYTAAVATDPVRATQAFLTRLAQVPNWQTIPLTEAAADVQNPRADLRGAYAQWEPLAATITDLLWPAAAATAHSAPTTDPTSTDPSSASVPPVACAGQGGANPSTGQHGNNVAGATTIPDGLVLNGSHPAQIAVQYALAQLGKPYVFAASGPDSFDCSGLTMAAWSAAGVALPHLAAAQAGEGTPEPLDLTEAVAGDLVFIPGSDGTAQAPGHVGIVVGYVDDKTGHHLYVEQAPMDGIPVEITDLSEWAGQIVAVRHLR